MAKVVKTMHGEILKPVVGYEGIYEVSNVGRVFSIRTFAGNPRRKLMSPYIDHKGYHRVGLSRGGKRNGYTVHRLVLTAFCGPRAKDGMAMHLNNKRRDNRLNNLRWGTSRQNVDQMVRDGRSVWGWRSPRAKLCKADIQDIKRSSRSGESRSSIARRLKVSADIIGNVLRGKTYIPGFLRKRG